MAVRKASTASKTDSQKPKGEVSAKKKAKKKPNRPAKGLKIDALPLHKNIDPQVLADLAIKIIHLRSGNGPTAGTQPERLKNSEMHDAIDDARRFLLAVEGVIDEDVDAYRLFSVDDGLMSYEEIAKRFKIRGWKLMTSRNKVEEIILKLVDLAEKEVQKESEKYEVLVSVRHRYAGGVYGLVNRARERIRAMICDFELEMLFSDPDQVADVMGQFFLHLMGKDITGDWERHLDEEFADVAGFNSFLGYVCGEMIYEQFIPKGINVRMDAERLACLEFFLESVDAWAISDYKAKAKDLNILMRFILKRNDVPASLVGHLKNCLMELRKNPANAESVRKMAKAAIEELKMCCERMYLTQVIKVQQWNSLIDLLGLLSEFKSLPEQFPEENIKYLHRLLKQTEESVKKADSDPTVIRANLNEISVKLAEASALLKATESQEFAEDMDKIADGLEKGLRMERFLPKDSGRALEKLLTDLKPLQGPRKCRPYELFLFAAQNRICREDLVRKRSALVPGVVTGPPYWGSLSILMSHRGAEIAMWNQETG